MNTIFFPDKILPQVANNNNVLEKLLKMFLDSYKESLEELKQALSNKDYDNLQKLAHHMKPTILLLFPNSNHETIKFLEKQSSINTDLETNQMFEQLTSDIEVFITEAKIFLSKA